MAKLFGIDTSVLEGVLGGDKVTIKVEKDDLEKVMGMLSNENTQKIVTELMKVVTKAEKESGTKANIPQMDPKNVNPAQLAQLANSVLPYLSQNAPDLLSKAQSILAGGQKGEQK